MSAVGIGRKYTQTLSTNAKKSISIIVQLPVRTKGTILQTDEWWILTKSAIHFNWEKNTKKLSQHDSVPPIKCVNSTEQFLCPKLSNISVLWMMMSPNFPNCCSVFTKYVCEICQHSVGNMLIFLFRFLTWTKVYECDVFEWYESFHLNDN